MKNGAINHAVPHPVTPTQIKVAGMAGDLYGSPDGRPSLVLLSGLTYGRGIWQPVLGHLGRIDPGRQVLNLDLPGHGDSPDQLAHTMERIVGLVHEAVGEAGLGRPVLTGHSSPAASPPCTPRSIPPAASSTWMRHSISGRLSR
jgi:pimeloyl-ACP methyl ester carboxylesterase